MLTFAMCDVAGGELSRESNPCVTFHRPLELALELTNCCARAHDDGVAVGECLHFEPSQTFPPLPRWNVNARSLFGLQGGGLYIEGTATLTNTNVYSNQADTVRSLSALA